MLDLPPTTIPTAPVAEIASYGSTSVWVDPARGVLARRDGRTVLLKVSPTGLRDLDVGPAADGTPVAVYARCPGSCDVYAFSLQRGARERRVAAAARPGASERQPTVWQDTVAFTRGSATYTTRIGSTAPAALLMRASGFDDLELGPASLAFSGEYSSDEGNGATEVDVVPLAKPRGDWSVLDRAVIGEGSAAGFGGITADAKGFTWLRAFRNGCATARRASRRGTLRAAGRTIASSAAPLAARYADPPIPATPESEGCDEE
jgi:hypothetical protein